MLRTNLAMWNPFALVNDQMNRLLNYDLEHPHRQARLHRPPSVNVLESSDAYYLEAELPGVSAENVNIDVTDESVVLTCERKNTVDVKEDAYRRQERWSGGWKRELAFPKRIQTDAVGAQLVDGILLVRLPKAIDQQPRRVSVQSTPNQPIIDAQTTPSINGN